MPVPLQIAVAQPPCVTGALVANAEAHALTVLAARARLVVFPELSLTGYDLEASTVAVDDPALAAIVEACDTMNTIALVGAPTSDRTVGAPTSDRTVGRAIAILLIDAQGARVVYRKQHLGSAESEHFTPGPRPVVLDLDGWRVGLGVCRDTGIGDHVKALADTGIDLYVAGLVDHPGDVGVQRERAARIATTCRAYVGFASFAGPTAGGYDETAGRSAVFARNGSVIAETSELPGGIVRALLV
ncbi:MAG TPA: carbon-nitrogen hydrolase family protein [Microlunatus sp.]